MALLMIERPGGWICLKCNPREKTEFERLKAEVADMRAAIEMIGIVPDKLLNEWRKAKRCP